MATGAARLLPERAGLRQKKQGKGTRNEARQPMLVLYHEVMSLCAQKEHLDMLDIIGERGMPLRSRCRRGEPRPLEAV